MTTAAHDIESNTDKNHNTARIPDTHLHTNKQTNKMFICVDWGIKYCYVLLDHPYPSNQHQVLHHPDVKCLNYEHGFTNCPPVYSIKL